MHQDKETMRTGVIALLVVVVALAAVALLMPSVKWKLVWWAVQGLIIACSASWLHGRTSGDPGYLRSWTCKVGHRAARRSTLAAGIPMLILIAIFAFLPSNFGSGVATQHTLDYKPKVVVQAIPREVIALDQYHLISDTQYFVEEDRGFVWKTLNKQQPPPPGESWYTYNITLQARSPVGEIDAGGALGLRLVADNGRSYIPEVEGTVNTGPGGFVSQEQPAVLSPSFRLPDNVHPVYLELTGHHRNGSVTVVIVRKPTAIEKEQLALRIRKLGDAHGRGRDSGARDAIPVTPAQRHVVPDVPSSAASANK